MKKFYSLTIASLFESYLQYDLKFVIFLSSVLTVSLSVKVRFSNSFLICVYHQHSDLCQSKRESDCAPAARKLLSNTFLTCQTLYYQKLVYFLFFSTANFYILSIVLCVNQELIVCKPDVKSGALADIAGGIDMWRILLCHFQRVNVMLTWSKWF